MQFSLNSVSKTYGANTVLRDISFVVNAGERTGIVGMNGAGKSTLLRLLAGAEMPDSATLTRTPGITIGYLPQALPFARGETVGDVLRDATGPLRTLEARMRQLEAEMSTATEDAIAALLDEYGVLSTRFQDAGGYELDHRLDAVLAGMGIAYLSAETSLATLSGGERTRLGLARLLLRAPGALLLDEPTNHLDLATLGWLEDYLSGYAGTLLVVSHDRQFLNRTITRILEIDEHTRTITVYAGSYDDYAHEKRRAVEQWRDDYQRQQEEIRELRKRIREAPTLNAHNRKPRDSFMAAYNAHGEAVARAQSSNIRAAEERLRRIEADPIPKPPKPLGYYLTLRTDPIQSNVILAAEHVSKRFGARQVLDDITFSVLPGAHILLSGPNGAGKTTLLRLLLGLEQPDTGGIRCAPGARPGYLPQAPELPQPERTVLDVYRDGLPGEESAHIASLLAQGNFRLEDLSKQVSQLSLGQQRKLEIVRLLAHCPNVLLLDEPTNHLSLDVLEGFEAALLRFPGPIVAVSHDRTFIQRFGGDLWELRDGTLATREGVVPSPSPPPHDGERAG